MLQWRGNEGQALEWGRGREASWLLALGNQAWYRFTRTQIINK